MARRRKPVRLTPGDRVRMTVSGMSWGGISVPRGTLGTYYLAPRPGDRPPWRAVHWDGFPPLQPNGYPFGMGGNHLDDWCPTWAEKV